MHCLIVGEHIGPLLIQGQCIQKDLCVIAFMPS